MASEPQSGASPRILFGPFEFDELSGSLHKRGIRVRLQGQPLQILSALLRRSGQVISREDFQRELWRESTFVDFEHGLNAAVNRLRQTLGDSAEQPRYIETLSGRGYRFIAPIQELGPQPVPAIPLPIADKPPLKKSWRWKSSIPRGWAIATAALFTGSLCGYLAGHRSQLPPLLQSVQFAVPAPAGYALQTASSRQSFALSPDGTSLAFTAMDAGGSFRTFIREFNRLEPRPLAGSIGSYTLFWAPDGRSLYFTARGTLRRSTLDGDSQHVLADAPTLMLVGATLPQNRLLLSGRAKSFVIPVSGGTPQPLKEMYDWAQMLPDGEHVLYSVFDSRIGRHRVRVAKFGQPDTAKDLIESDSRAVYTPSSLKNENGHILSVRGGNLLAYPFDVRALQILGQPVALLSKIYAFHPTGAADFSVSNGVLAYQRYAGRSQLAWVDRRGQTISTIGPGGVNLKLARLSPDGKKIATSIYDVEGGINRIWIIDAQTGAARQVVPGPGLVDNPVWSPDSTRLAFNRAFDSPPKLFVRGVGQQDPEEALPPAYFQVPEDWSPDSRYIAFTNTGFAQIENEMQGDVWLVDMARGRKVTPLLHSPFHEANAAFSPDGRWLAFTSSESGRTELYIQAFRGGDSPGVFGERLVVSQNGAECLRWGRDGKELFYLGSDARIYAVSIALSAQPKIGTPTPLFAVSTEAMAAIHSQFGFDVSLDGRRFLIPTVTSTERSEIVVVQNWELAAKTNHGHLDLPASQRE